MSQVQRRIFKPPFWAANRAEVAPNYRGLWDGLSLGVPALGGQWIDYAHGERLTLSNIDAGVGALGYAAALDGTDSGAYIPDAERRNDKPDTEITAVSIVRVGESSIDDSFPYLLQGDPAAGETAYMLRNRQWNTSRDLQFALRVSGTLRYSLYAGVQVPQGRDILCVGRWKSGDYLRCDCYYVGGWRAFDQELSAATYSGTIGYSTGVDSERFTLWGRPSGTTAALVGLGYGGYVWNRSLSDAEVVKLARDPFGMFTRARRISVVVPAAVEEAGDLEVELGTASATWSATALGVGVGGISVALTAASATWSAETVGVSLGTEVALSAASATWTAPSLGVAVGGISVALTSAAATWTAPAVGVAVGGISVALSAASGTWTAAAVGVAVGGISVALTSAPATWSAETVGVSLGTVVPLTSASATWTAPAVGVGVGGISVALSSAPATWTAAAVGVSAGIVVGLTSAAATWSAPAVGVGVGGISVALSSASATWTAPSVSPGVGGISVALVSASATWTAPAVGTAEGIVVGVTSAAATWNATTITAVVTKPDVIMFTDFAVSIAQLSSVDVAIAQLADVGIREY
jgi:hypothetical protein